MIPFIDTFVKHRSEPGKTLDAYTREARLALGQEIAGCKKVYLDTKYWLLLRDAAMGRAKDVHAPELLAVLRRGVSENRAICPIGEDVFVEVLAQSDWETLRETARVIDALSKGVSILSEQERIGFEALYFILETTKGSDSVYPPYLFVWSKLAYVLGAVHPTFAAFPAEEELILQKAFFDQMWSISLSQMIEIMGNKAVAEAPKLKDLSLTLNEGKFKHAHENSSFKQLFLAELAGFLDTCIPIFEEAMTYLFKKETGRAPTRGELEGARAGKQIANAVYNLFRMNKLKDYFPTIVIGAGLHASVRWDLKRKFKRTDLHDFRHAQAALPYFDLFFTEHSLRDLVTRTHISFSKLYQCEVLSHPGDVLRRATQLCS